MKLALKRCNKDIITADCVNFDLTMPSLINATLTNQVKINDNLYLIYDVEAKESNKPINFALIKEESENNFTFLEFINGDVIFIRKNNEGLVVDIEEEDLDFLYLNHMEKALVSEKKNLRFDTLEIPKHIDI